MANGVENADGTVRTEGAIEMLSYYSHIRQDAKRKAVATLDNEQITSQLSKWKAKAEERGSWSPTLTAKDAVRMGHPAPGTRHLSLNGGSVGNEGNIPSVPSFPSFLEGHR
jgi:hypothetical protein